jgi:hypothetical protein
MLSHIFSVAHGTLFCIVSANGLPIAGTVLSGHCIFCSKHPIRPHSVSINGHSLRIFLCVDGIHSCVFLHYMAMRQTAKFIVYRPHARFQRYLSVQDLRPGTRPIDRLCFLFLWYLGGTVLHITFSCIIYAMQKCCQHCACVNGAFYMGTVHQSHPGASRVPKIFG